MTVAKGAIAKPRTILGIRDLVREDLAALKEGRSTKTVDRFKDPHHRLARMYASGLRHQEVFAKSGYSMQRLTSLFMDPAFQELIAHYRKMVDEAWVETQEDFFTLATSNMVRAEKHVAQRLDEAEEAGEAIPIKDALAISRDAADRFGFGKKQTNINVNVDFASQLEKAIKRSGKQIELSPVQAVTSSPGKVLVASEDDGSKPGARTTSGREPYDVYPRPVRATNENPRVAGPPQHAPHAQVPQRLGSHPSIEPVRRRA